MPAIFPADFAIPEASPKTGMKLGCPKWQNLRMNSLSIVLILFSLTATAMAAKSDCNPFIAGKCSNRKAHRINLMKTNFTALALSLLVVGTAGAQTAGGLLRYDYPSLVAHADLSFDTPAPGNHDGLPIGNGRMGTLVWTTPGALHYQINHDDLFCFEIGRASCRERV